MSETISRQSLVDFQAALLQLYTHGDSLRLFTQKPDEYLAKFSLTERERSAIMQIRDRDLAQFHNQLYFKLLGRVKQVLERPGNVVAIPFHPCSSPVIAWGKQPSFIPITSGMYTLLEQLQEEKKPASFKFILKTYSQCKDETVSLSDVYKLSRLVSQRRWHDLLIRVI